MDVLHQVRRLFEAGLLQGTLFWNEGKDVSHAEAQGLSDQLASYSEEGYACMTRDKNRNYAYARAIQAVERSRTDGETHFWMDVGTGADACLSQMVLENKNTYVFALDANETSATMAKSKLHKNPTFKRMLQNNYQDRYLVLSGFSSDAGVQKEIKDSLDLHEQELSGVVQEILGFFAGCEGVVAVMNDLRAKMMEEQTQVVPQLAATFFQPVFLTRDDLAKQVSKRSQEMMVATDVMVLVDTINFQTAAPTVAESSSRTGLLEWLDFRSFIDTKQTNRVRFEYSEAVAVNGLGLWLWCRTGEDEKARKNPTEFPYGCTEPAVVDAMGDGHAWEFSSFQGDKQKAIGWHNVFLPFAETVRVTSLTVTTEANLESSEPTYRILVTDQAANVLYNEALKNLYPVWQKVDKQSKTARQSYSRQMQRRNRSRSVERRSRSRSAANDRRPTLPQSDSLSVERRSRSRSAANDRLSALLQSGSLSDAAPRDESQPSRSVEFRSRRSPSVEFRTRRSPSVEFSSVTPQSRFRTRSTVSPPRAWEDFSTLDQDNAAVEERKFINLTSSGSEDTASEDNSTDSEEDVPRSKTVRAQNRLSSLRNVIDLTHL